jgi:hypothetical protein
MPLPSLYISGEGARAWSIVRAAGYGAGIGALASVFKTMGPLHSTAADPLATTLEITGVTLAFAALCAGAAALRNLVARRLIWPEGR